MTDLNKKFPISEEEFLRKIEKMYSEYIVEEISCYMEPGFRDRPDGYDAGRVL